MDRTRAPEHRSAGLIDRRTFLRYGAYAGAGAAAAPALAGLMPSAAAAAPTGPRRSADAGRPFDPSPFPWEEWSIAQFQAAMETGDLTARDLTQAYIARIQEVDQTGPIQLNSVMEINPDAIAIAERLDDERKKGKVRGPMHGIPVLLKDNVATQDRMETTAGSLALLGSVVPRDAFIAERLRKAGAVLLGKANLSEWANFRSLQSSSGWSGRAGQCLQPYVLDHNPCGSSSGSGAAVSANLCAAAIGTETDGSIVCPSSNNALAGIKPTLGLTSRSGVIPIAHSQDVTGPMCRSVADAATVLGAIVGVDQRDHATKDSKGHFYRDYTQFLDPNGLQGARIGVWRDGVFGISPEGDAIADAAFEAMASLGATIVDPTDIPNVNDVFDPEFTVLLFEFKHDVNAYLKGLTKSGVRSLKDLIAYDEAHAGTEMPWFAQEIFEIAQATDGLDDPVYLQALDDSGPVMRAAIDDTLAANGLDAIVSLTGGPPWTTDLVNGDHFLTASSTPAAVAGYPSINVLAGYSFDELPVGIAFIGTRWSEPTLIKLAYAFEVNMALRHAPTFLPSLGVRDFVPRGTQGPRGSAATGSVGARNARPDTPGARMAGRL